jgi:hypothetical protein
MQLHRKEGDLATPAIVLARESADGNRFARSGMDAHVRLAVADKPMRLLDDS